MPPFMGHSHAYVQYRMVMIKSSAFESNHFVLFSIYICILTQPNAFLIVCTKRKILENQTCLVFEKNQLNIQL